MILAFKETKALPMPSEPGRDMQSMEKDECVNNEVVDETAQVTNNVEAEVNADATIPDKVENEPPVGSMEYEFRKLRLSIGEEFAEPEYLLEVDGVKCMPKGDFSIIKATQKSGKTMAIACIVATMLKSELWRLKAIEEGTKIIVFDTEQSRPLTHKFYHRVLKMADEEEDIHSRFETLNLRELTKDERVNLICYAIKTYLPDLVVIDGIVDLCNDFNNIEYSNNVIEMLMQLSSKYNCHIIGVIHTNPSDGDGKGRGHLGTMAAQKAFEVMQMNKDKCGTFTVSSYCSREIPMPSWKFRFDGDGNLVCADDDTYNSKEETKAKKEEKKKTEISNFVDEIITEKGGTAKYSEIADYLMNTLNLKKSAVYERIDLVKDMYDVNGKSFSIKPTEETMATWDSTSTDDYWTTELKN